MVIEIIEFFARFVTQRMFLFIGDEYSLYYSFYFSIYFKYLIIKNSSW